MDFRILGPLEAGDPPIALGGGKPRALLAVLLLNAGRTVARTRLIDDLWGEGVPETAIKMVQIHVSQLRKSLPPGLLVTRGPGYALDIPPQSVDLHRAEAMLDEGRAALAAGDPAAAAAGLRAALALWRGPALSEFEEPFARSEVARIDELQLALTEERIDADLALGGHARIVGELEALIARHPLRERLRSQLMLGLYRCGRQADALAVFQETRRALGEELGLEPSPALREMERRILRQDPGLDSRPAAEAGGPATARTPPSAAPSPTGPTVGYARSGDLSIAYEVTGTGPPDLVLVPGFVSHLTMDRAEPRHAHFLDRLAGFSRLIRFDKRGTGLSDRPPGLPDLETRMDDVRAVMDAAGSRRAVLVGYSEGGPLSTLFAATHPDRVAALVLVNSYAKRTDPDADYPWATPREVRRRMIAALEEDWGYEALGAALCPSADEAMRRWWAERCRAAASPGAARALSEMNARIDVRDVLPTIRVPTLVVHRTGDMRVVVGHGRYLAERIPGARLVEIPGIDHFVGVDSDRILDVVEPWVRALSAAPAPASPAGSERAVLATILAVSGAADEAAVREEVARRRGQLSDRVARFDGPTRAIRCALAIAGAQEGARLGLHTGEVTGAGGPAVEDAAALAAAAEPGEVLVTATTRDLVPGAGLRFEDRGERRLSGGSLRRVYAAAEGDEERATAPEAAPSTTGPPSAPFAGRRREMALLQTALDETLAGDGRLVLIAGEPGIGKTRTAGELAARASASGALVLRGRAYEREGAPPYWPWSQALAQLVAASDATELSEDAGDAAGDVATLVPALRQRLGDLPQPLAAGDAEQARFRLLQAGAGLLRAASARRPLVVVLEDLHAADTGTLHLLECVARELPGSRLLVVGTYRDADVAAGHPLAETLAELTREGLLQRVALSGLARDEVAMVLGAAAGSQPPAALVDAALSQTEGNPLFLTELVRLLQQGGDAAPGPDGWELRIPDGVRSVIGLRLARLSDGCSEALRMAAVLGRELGVRELGAALGDPSGGRALLAVDEALTARVLAEVEGAPGRVLFSHALFREVLLEQMSTARRAHLSGQVLRVLEDLYGEGAADHAAELLHHAEEAEPALGPDPVARYALLAGERALGARAYEEAATLYRRALAALGDAASDGRAAEAHFGLGRALLAARELHELDEAVANLSRAFDLRARAGDRARAIAVATHPIPPHLHLEAAGATRLVERALELVDPSSADASRLLSTLGWLTGICRADAGGAHVAFDRAIAIAGALDSPELEVRALVQRQYVEMFHLRWEECRATGLRAIDLATRTGDRRNEMAARGWVARALARAGDLEGARRQAAAATPHAEALRERYWRATAGLHNAMLAELAGEWAGAREWSDAALAARPRDPRALGLRALVEYQTGELTEGAALVARLCAPLASEPVPGPGAEHPFAAAHVPLCDRIGGVDDEHRAAAERAGWAVLGLAAVPPYLRSLAHIGLGLSAVRDGDAAGAAVHYAALAPFAGAASAIPPVAMDRLLCVMALAAEDVAGAVAHGRDAVAFCERAGYLPELAWSACDLSAALAEAGEPDEAAGLRARAQAIAREIGMRSLLSHLTPAP